jgi:hypothetical protein
MRAGAVHLASALALCTACSGGSTSNAAAGDAGTTAPDSSAHADDGGGATGTDSGRADAADAGQTAATDAGVADAASDAAQPDDLSLCAPDALVFTQRSQLNHYGIAYTNAEATLENYPVTQYRPVIGLPAWGPTFKNNTIAVRVRVPATYPVVHPDHYGFIHVAEAPGQAVTSRELCVSARACDFSACTAAGDTAPGIDFTVGNPGGGTVDFSPGQVVWINLRNVASDLGPSCPADAEACGILLDFASPNRY